ncbi:uncharacterized protein EV422DRAFT_319532 [Fimicolochytrium jonesii]|uniref:uncharacterized protein n=1 Tax=Fimicolochytrium jonesii TaxID=1396493 RepID=UPI0022FE3469|nr:uncharacterized protein EV422DRAFT_319532 [Fimicolochytrium jonesii]KAI8824413.1 hypothetical protein EV422DRAFT_319532 [Fimicolochytrium jonesii]
MVTQQPGQSLVNTTRALANRLQIFTPESIFRGRFGGAYAFDPSFRSVATEAKSEMPRGVEGVQRGSSQLPGHTVVSVQDLRGGDASAEHAPGICRRNESPGNEHAVPPVEATFAATHVTSSSATGRQYGVFWDLVAAHHAHPQLRSMFPYPASDSIENLTLIRYRPSVEPQPQLVRRVFFRTQSRYVVAEVERRSTTEEVHQIIAVSRTQPHSQENGLLVSGTMLTNSQGSRSEYRMSNDMACLLLRLR